MKIVPSLSWTMEKCSTKCAIDDNYQITALLTCTAAGNILLIQLVYEVMTKRYFPCLPARVGHKPLLNSSIYVAINIVISIVL